MEQQQQDQNNQGAAPDPVTSEGYQLMKEKGIYIEESDPEYRSIKPDGSIREFLSSIERAIEAKSKRVSGKRSVPDAGDELIERLKALPAADVEELVSDYSARKDELDRQAVEAAKSKQLNPLRRSYKADLAKLQRGDTWGITQLQAKYKRMGLTDY
jgi:hypothetical protein